MENIKVDFMEIMIQVQQLGEKFKDVEGLKEHVQDILQTINREEQKYEKKIEQIREIGFQLSNRF